MSRRSAEGRPRGRGFPVVFRPPALACWASCSRRGLPPSSRSAYQVGAKASTRTPTGFPRSAHPSHGRIGCPLYPETTRCSAAGPIPPTVARPLFQGPGPIAPVHIPSPEAVYYGASSRVHLRSPARLSPRPGHPWMEQGPPWAHSPGSAPRRPGVCRARRGGRRASSTRPELPYDRHRRTSFPVAHSQCATSCRTIGTDMSRFATPEQNRQGQPVPEGSTR